MVHPGHGHLSAAEPPDHDAVRIPELPESSLIPLATKWVQDRYLYNSRHLLNSLEWLDRLAPDATLAMRLATLTHDMERAFPGPDQPLARSFVDAEYYALHSARSARIVGAWLRQMGADETLTAGVEGLIQAHEIGGWPEANLVQAADSLSFLETNIDLFLGMVSSGKRTAAEVKEKFDYSYDRIQVPEAKKLAGPLRDRANARLAALTPEIPLR
jgi:hypothetical protein